MTLNLIEQLRPYTPLTRLCSFQPDLCCLWLDLENGMRGLKRSTVAWGRLKMVCVEEWVEGRNISRGKGCAGTYGVTISLGLMRTVRKDGSNIFSYTAMISCLFFFNFISLSLSLLFCKRMCWFPLYIDSWILSSHLIYTITFTGTLFSSYVEVDG